MLSRLMCTKPLISSALVKQSLNGYGNINYVARSFARDSREAFTRTARARGPTLRERAMAPAGPAAFNIGRGALAGGAAVGIGALCFYGLGLGTGTNTLENSHLWPQYVRQRISDSYFYLGSSLAVTAASAVAVFRTPALVNLAARGGWMSFLVTGALMIGSGALTRSIPYQPGFGTKQMAWLAHSAIIGGVIAPLCFLGGPLMMRAAVYTAGIVGGMSTVAVCAPSDKFLYMGGPLAIGLGVVFASSVGSMFLPPTTALGAGLYSISLYGGLLLFSAFLLYDTQKIIKQAEHYPLYAATPFDPINA